MGSAHSFTIQRMSTYISMDNEPRIRQSRSTCLREDVGAREPPRQPGDQIGGPHGGELVVLIERAAAVHLSCIFIL